MIQTLSAIKAFLLLIIVFTTTVSQAAQKNFTQQQVAEDFDTLYESVIATHYNAFAYISPDVFAQEYQLLKSQLTADNYSLLAATAHFQKLVSKIDNGHTEVEFPVAPYLDYAQAGGKLFPLDLALEGSEAFVRANYSLDATIAHGTEVIAINGMPMANVLAKIYPLISAERLYFKNAKLEVLSFPRYYWYAFGERETFNLTIRNKGSVSNITLAAIDAIDDFETKKGEILNAKQTLKFFDKTAYLNPGHFSGDETAYQQFIDDSFAQIVASKAKNLIIDLRNNSGGNDSFSDYLIAYLANKPFKWHSRFHLRTSQLLQQDTKQNNRDLNNPYWQAIMENEQGTRFLFEFEFYQPVAEHKRFHGEVYVLINRHSHSQASVTAAQIKDLQLGTVVGEETGDYPTLYASQFQYQLPITGITVKISKGYIVRVSGAESQHGVIPQIVIADHLRDQHDEILSALLAKLR